MLRDPDSYYLGEALDAAKMAERAGEVPVGSVVVMDDAIVARAFNLRERTQDPSAHAEMIAVREAAARVGSWRLTGATVYVTLEPCPMCAGLLVNARVDRVVWGCDDPKAGALRTLYEIGSDTRLNHRIAVTGGVRADECAALLSRFFSRIRDRNERTK